MSAISSTMRSDGRGSRSDGLRMKRVAARDGVRQEPQRDHRREVERRDRGADADGLAHELDVHSGRDSFEVLALQEVRDAASGLGRLDSAEHLAARVVKRLAHVLGDEAGDLLVVGPERFAHAPSRRGRASAVASLAKPGMPRARRAQRRPRRPRPRAGPSAATSPVAGFTSSSVSRSSGLDPAAADEVSKRACLSCFRHASDCDWSAHAETFEQLVSCCAEVPGTRALRACAVARRLVAARRTGTTSP